MLFWLALHETLVVAPAQFVNQVFKLRGRFQIFRAQALLQPFANGIADGSARGVIDRLADFVDSAGHCQFR